MTTHKCAARRCDRDVHESLLMCLKHWRMVPGRLKVTLKDADASEYAKVAKACVTHVAEMEKSKLNRRIK